MKNKQSEILRLKRILIQSPVNQHNNTPFVDTLSYQLKKYSLLLLLVFGSFVSALAQNTTTSAPVTSTGNFVVPAGITKVTVECWGGGGGGGGCNGSSTATTQRAGGGGAGGSYIIATGVTVAPGNVLCTIGGGGNGGVGSSPTNGVAGSSTTFASGTPVTALGGGGGKTGVSGDDTGDGGVAAAGTFAGGAGTSAAGTDPVATSGGDGGGGAGNTGAGSGATGGTGTGAGVGGNGALGIGTNGNGASATQLSGGGAGAFTDDNGDHNGGNGFKGQVIVSYTQATSAGTYLKSVVKTGDTQTITVTFSEAVTGTPKITVTGSSTGVIVNNVNMTGSGTTWTHTSTTWPGNQTATVTVGTATGSVAGIGNVVFPTPTTNTFSIDNTPPVVSAHNITNSAAGAFDYNITLDDVGTTYYEVTTSATPPTAAQIKLGTGPSHVALGNFPVPVASTITTFNVNGLGAGTFYIYSVSEDAQGNQSTPIVSDNTTFACVAPTSQATGSGTPFTNVKAKSLTYNWIRGNGTGGVIVVIKQAGGPGAPSSGTTYTGVNSDFSLATDQGGGTKVVYVGTGTSVAITNLAPNTNYNFAVYEFNTAGTCYLLTSPVINNTNTAALANETTLSAGTGSATISSNVISQALEVNAFTFSAADAGADGETTKISQMTFKPGGGNFFTDFTDIIAGAELYDNAGNGPAGTVTIAAGSIQVASIPTGAGLLGDIADGATKIYTLKIWLKNPFASAVRTTADGQKIVLSIVNPDVITVATGSGISGSATDSGGGNGTIDVTATKLLFVQGPSNVVSGVAMTPAVTVEATDAQGNRDTGFTSTVGITSTGTLSTSPQDATFSSGLGTYSSITHTVAATNRQLTTNSGTLTNPTSANFNVTASNASNIVADGSFTYPQNIAYDTYQENANIVNSGSSKVVASFKIQDGGGAADADNNPTTLTNLTLNLGTNFNYIRRIALYDAAGTTEIPLTEQAVSSSTVSFTGLSLSAPDDGSLTFTVRVSFKTIVADNQAISFTITNTSTAAGSSGFTLVTAGGAASSTSGNDNHVEVLAIKYLFVQQPTGTAAGVAMSPAPTVEAVDALNNRDLDYNGSVGIVSTGTLSSSPQNATFSSGFATYSNIVHTASGSGLTLSTNSGTFVNAVSSVFQVAGASSDITANTLFSYPASIPYINFQENVNITNSGSSLAVAKFDINDGGGSPDGDNAPTTLTNLTLDLGANFGFIRRIALYDATGTTEIPGTEQVVGSQTVVFGGLTLTAPDDGTLSFTVRVSFTTAVLDEQAFSVTITAATAQAGSSLFVAANAGGASTSAFAGSNTINVSVTKLRFGQQPTNTPLGAVTTPAVTIEASDAFDNRDIDFNTISFFPVVVSSSGVMSPSSMSVSIVSGFATLPNFVHNSAATGIQLFTSNFYGLTEAVSSPFNVAASSASNIILNSSFVTPTNIAYANFQSTNISFFNSVIVGKFDVQDGGGAADGDNVGTTLSALSLDLGPNFGLIRKVAIYDAVGFTELAELAIPVATQVVSFPALSISTVDNGATSFNVRVTFNTVVTDNQQFSIGINSATAVVGASSTFAAANAGGAITSTAGDDNRIEVSATKLQFTSNLGSPLLPSKDISLQQTVPVVTAMDGNGNTDKDYVATVALSSGIGLTPTTLTVDNAAPNGGVYTFPNNFQFTQTGSFIAVTASSGALSVGTSNFINVQAGSATTITAGAASPATISSLITTAGAQVAVFNFNINDDPSGTPASSDDGFPTLISSIAITGSGPVNNTVDEWTQVIAGAELFDGSGHSQLATSISDNQILFSGIPTTSNTLGFVSDNATQAYTLKIYLKSTLGTTWPTKIDNKRFGFQVIASDITTDPTNSTNIINLQNANSGANDRVVVNATQLNFISPVAPPNPAIASLGAPFPGVTVEATDVNSNRDLDFTGANSTVTQITNTTNATMANQPVVGTTQFGTGVNAGLLFFNSTFKYTSGTNLDNVTLTIKAGPSGGGTTCGSGGIICGTSIPIVIQSSFETRIKVDPAYVYAAKIPYAKYPANDIQSSDIGTGLHSYEISRLLLSDGDADFIPGDVDAAQSTLTAIKIGIVDASDISTLESIQRIAIYNSGFAGANELADVTVTGTDITNGFVSFTGLNIIAPDDGTNVISVRISFKNTSATIFDGKLLRLKIVDATLGVGSAFRNLVGDIAGVSGGYKAPLGANAIDVVATKLDFTQFPSQYAGVNESVIVGGIVSARDQNSLLDTGHNFAAVVTTPEAGVTGTYTFSAGVLTLNGLLNYDSDGDGTPKITSNGLTSDVNNTVDGLPNDAIESTQVDVIHITTQRNDGGGAVPPGTNGGNLLANSVGKALFGFQFSSLHPIVAAQLPKITHFVISFDNPITGTFQNLRVVESTTGTYTTTLPDVTASGATVTQTTNSLVVDFSSPRDLSANPNLSFFVIGDVNINVNGGTPAMTLSLTDAGRGTSTENNIQALPAEASQLSNIQGPKFTFASVAPPILVSSYPAVAQTNIDPTQPTIELTFSVPVYTLDAVITIHDKAANTSLVLQSIQPKFKGDGSDDPVGYQPLQFIVPAGTLDFDKQYYITIAKGVINSDNTGVGIMDVNRNLFGGISYEGTLYFRTASTAAPKLLSTPVSTTNPVISDVTANSAVIKATFDKQGDAYYLVLAQGSAAPTKAQIFAGGAGYPGSVKAAGTFPIVGTNTTPQSGVITPTTGTFPAGPYDVWVAAQSYKEKYVSSTIIRTPIQTISYYGGSPNYADNTTGPTLVFNAPGPSTNTAITTNLLKTNTAITFCSNSFQIVNTPIIFYEGTIAKFNAAGTQTFNLVLPAGFSFDISKTSGGVPVYGAVKLQGSDFQAGSGALSYLSTSVLKISFINTGTVSQDQIIITGLRIQSSGTASGNIFRLGGNAFPTLADGVSIGGISASEAPAVNFDNSYSTSLGLSLSSTTLIETAIPDNVSSGKVTLTPYITNGFDFGPSLFTGQGVDVNTITLAGVTKDSPFNITITHTDNNGCISQNAVQYVVYDHLRGINITNPLKNTPGVIPVTLDQGPYCAQNPSFKIDQQIAFAPPTGTERFITYDNLPGYFLSDLTADIPTGSTAIINATDFGGKWVNIVQGLPIFTTSQVVGTVTYKNFKFDDKTIVDAHAGSGNVIPYVYDFFKQQTTAPSSSLYSPQTYYTGGSLGQVEFTGTFRNAANPTVIIHRRQLVEFFLPAVPVVEIVTPYSFLDILDPLNPPGKGGNAPNNVRPGNPGTPVFCQGSGLIVINGWPKSTSTTPGVFRIFDAVTNTDITGAGFVDNSNGTAQLDPTIISNSYNDIRIEYTYRDAVNAAVCSSMASQHIRISPNPVAAFIQSNLPSQFIVAGATKYCAGQPIQFDATTSTVGGGATIATYAWDFTDATNSTGSNPNIFTGNAGSSVVTGVPAAGTFDKPVHFFAQTAAYTPALTVVSNYKCASDPISAPISVGAIPTVDFGFTGVSNQITFTNNSAVNSAAVLGDGFKLLNWTFGDGQTLAVTSGFTGTQLHFYANPDVYAGAKAVNLKVTSLNGCTDNVSKAIVVLPKFTATPSVTYFEKFETSDGNWKVFNTGNVATGGISQSTKTWAYNNTTGASLIVNDPAITETKFWKTNNPTTGTYDGGEHSALYSPAFDMAQLKRPMVSFNDYVQMRNGDGVVLQFSTDNKNVADPSKVWIALGNIGDGVQWFTDQGISASPGEQTANLGWSGSNIMKWQEPKHTLDAVAQTGGPLDQVVFRFALASAPGAPVDPNFEGFGLDNFRVGERTRTILLESFANTSNTSPAEAVQNQAVAQFQSSAAAIGTEVIKMNYHVNFPGRDPFNEDNPADPSSRALFYNITTTPVSRMDGSDGPNQATIPNQPFKDWKDLQYATRTLQLAQADIVIRPSTGSPAINSNGKISIMVDITPSVNLDDKTILQVAIVEEKILLTNLLPTTKQALVKSGETQFEWVPKKMLPTAAGTKTKDHPNAASGVLAAGTTAVPKTYTFGPFEWIPSNMYAPNTADLAVVVFLQSESGSHTVYQAELAKDLDDPANVITGLEPLMADDVNVFPNPANAEMNITLPGKLVDAAPLQMIDQTGRVILESSFSAGSKSKVINTVDLSPGLYILQINVGNGNFARKKVMVVH